MTLIEALRDYKQADKDGVIVLVSRQACDEAADEIVRLRDALRLIAWDIEGQEPDLGQCMNIADAALAEPSTTRLIKV